MTATYQGSSDVGEIDFSSTREIEAAWDVQP